MSEFSMHIMFADDLMLQEIADKKCKRKDIARTYALALRSDHPCNFAKVNKAIIERWSVSGLNWIKTAAWSGSCFKQLTKEAQGDE